jgi:hypothetical protein
MRKYIIIISLLSTLLFMFAACVTCYAQGDAVYGCAKKKGGYLRIVTDVNQCKNSETLVTMNQGGAGSGDIKVYDAKGQYLGTLVQIETEEQNTVAIYVPSVQRIIRLDASACDGDCNGSEGLIYNGDEGFEVYYESNNCTGQAYVYYSFRKVTYVLPKYIDDVNIEYYTGKPMSSKTITALSSKPEGGGGCYVYSESLTQENVIEANKVTLPFTLPVALPLRYESTSIASPANLVIAPPSLVLTNPVVGNAANYTITGGSSPYTAYSSHPGLVSVSIIGATITAGVLSVPSADTSATITVMDSKGLTSSALLILDVPAQPVSAGIKVYDANNQYLGHFVQFNESTLTIYVPSANRMISLYMNGDLGGQIIYNYDSLVYESSNCTGTPYVSTYSMYEIREQTGKYYAGALMQSTTKNLFSVGTIGNCVTLTEPYTYEVVEAIEVALPFNFPVAIPLRLE